VAQLEAGKVRGDEPDWSTLINKSFLEEGIKTFKEVNGRAPRFSEPDSACG
jgi:hypothetical protein